MKIGLFDLNSKYHNLALMKLSSYHKQKGDLVEFYNPLWYKTYNRIYVSKIFTKKTINDCYLRPDMIMGGSGIDLTIKLPDEIEHTIPDYSLYNLDYSLGFTTRGCINNCPFCIVPKKEGKIKEHTEVKEFKNPKSDIVILLDNNFLALPSHIEKLKHYISKGWIMDFNQGLDLRLINDENANLLSKIKYYKQIRFAWDLMKNEKNIKEGLEIVIKYIKPYKIMVYILCGFNTTFEEDFYRFTELRRYGVEPFVMIYNNQKKNQKLRNFAKWVNRRYYKVCKWKEYKKEKEKTKWNGKSMLMGNFALL
jgi:hypothetical protein